MTYLETPTLEKESLTKCAEENHLPHHFGFAKMVFKRYQSVWFVTIQLNLTVRMDLMRTRLGAKVKLTKI